MKRERERERERERMDSGKKWAKKMLFMPRERSTTIFYFIF
jgi:hypothetical protein